MVSAKQKKKELKLCNEAFRTWGEMMEKLGEPSADDIYHLHLLPHAKACEYGNWKSIKYKCDGQWDYETYLWSSNVDSHPSVEICSGNNPALLLPDPGDGYYLKKCGVRILLRHRDIQNTKIDYKIFPGKIYEPSKRNDCKEDHESTASIFMCGFVDCKYRVNDAFNEIEKMEALIEKCTKNIAALTEYMKDVFDVEGEKKRKRE